MQDYLSLAKQHVKEDYAVIVIDNSDITKSASRKFEASLKCVMGVLARSYRAT